VDPQIESERARQRTEGRVRMRVPQTKMTTGSREIRVDLT
jgi:hypothetical protein